MATLTYYEWRMYIGPRYRPQWDARHYDWSVLAYGGTGQPEPLPSFLPTDFNSGETLLQLGSGLVYPAEGGGAWVGPNGSGEGWEYIEYESASPTLYRLYGCYRESAADRNHNGNHTTGAPIWFWYPVETAASELQITESMDSAWAAISWKANVGGVLFPRNAIRNNHLALIQVRNSPTGTWRNELIGWLASPTVNDDGQRVGAWSAQILSSAQMANRHEVKGVTAGEMNIAKHGGATGSEPLAKAYKERTAGDYTAADPDLSHRSAVDGNAGSLWIAEQFIGSQNWRTSNADPHWTYDAGWNIDTRFVVSGVYLQRPTGYNSEGYRWIELTAVEANDGLTTVQDCTIYTSDPANYVRATIGEADVEEGQKIIICEDETLFREENPVTAAKFVLELNSDNITIGNTSFWDDLDIAGDTIAFRKLHGDQEWMHGVAWGTSNGFAPDVPPGSNDQDYWYWHPGDKTLSGTDTKPDAPAPGEALRYLFNDANGGGDSTNAWDYWDTSTVVTPGYTIGEHGTTDGSPNRGMIHPVHLIVDLPVLPLVLRDDLAPASGIGDTIYVNDASGPNTGGLDASGVVQVADEQIQYSAKTSDGIIVQTRGYNGTAATAHNAGDAVRFVESGIATDAPPVKGLAWTRSGGTVYLKDFRVYTATDPDAAPPTSAQWVYDWTLVTTVTGYTAATWSYTLPATKRLRRIMVIFDAMTTDPARPRLNEFKIILDDAKYPSNEFLIADETPGDVMAVVLQAAGIPAGAITDNSTGAPLYDNVTASDRGWAVAADMADYANLRLTVDRASKMTISDDAYWSASSFTPAETWTRTEAGAMELVATLGEPVRQVRLSWKTADGGDGGTEYYPTAPDEVGEVMEIGEVIYPSQTVAVAAAAKRYYMMQYPYTFVIECAAEEPTMRPGAIHAITWQLHTDDKPITRLIMVEQVTHQIANNTWQTVITGAQIDRESEG